MKFGKGELAVQIKGNSQKVKKYTYFILKNHYKLIITIYLFGKRIKILIITVHCIRHECIHAQT